MKAVKVFALLPATALALWGTQSLADAPGVTMYQGFLSSAGGSPVTDVVSMTFRIYDTASGSTPLWEETQDNVQVDNGLFTVVLGTKVPLDPAIFSSPDRYLAISVNNGPEMSPRQRLGSVPYSFQSIQAEDARTLAGHPPEYFAKASDIKPVDITVGVDFSQNTAGEMLGRNPKDITSVTISAPTNGWLQVTMTGQFEATHDDESGSIFTCQASVSQSSGVFDNSRSITWTTNGYGIDKNAFTFITMFQVSAGDSTYFMTGKTTASGWMDTCKLTNATISALFVPHRY